MGNPRTARFFMENPNLKWMKTRGTPHFRKPRRVLTNGGLTNGGFTDGFDQWWNTCEFFLWGIDGGFLK